MPKENDPVSEWHQRLQLAARRALTEDAVTEIMEGIVRDAKRGDRAARQLVLRFLQMDQQPAAASAPVPQPPAQQVKANVVNIYPGRRKGKPRLINGTNGRAIHDREE